MIQFECTGCWQKIRVGDEQAGKRARCPFCRTVQPIPGQTALTVPGQDSQGPQVILDALPPPRPRKPRESRRVEIGREQLPVGPGIPTGADPSLSEVEPIEGNPFQFLEQAQAPNELGRLGPYRVLQLLGSGTIGYVFLAKEVVLDRLVALKTLAPGLAADAATRQRFLAEARAMASLQHDHIVTVFQVSEENGIPYLAMEYLQGESLEERLKVQKRISIAESLRLGREMSEALAVAHHVGVIHRDLKPANVWLDQPPTSAPEGELKKGGRVKLLDFGLTRGTGQDSVLSRQGVFLGTPGYVAPELAAGKEIDARCDLFSLGCVLYHMLTGQPPFEGPDNLSVVMAVAFDQPRRVREVNSTVPKDLSDLVMQLLAKKPDERPESAKKVARQLQDIEEVFLRPPAQAKYLSRDGLAFNSNLLTQGGLKGKVAFDDLPEDKPQPKRPPPRWITPVKYSFATLAWTIIVLLGALVVVVASNTQATRVDPYRIFANTFPALARKLEGEDEGNPLRQPIPSGPVKGLAQTPPANNPPDSGAGGASGAEVAPSPPGKTPADLTALRYAPFPLLQGQKVNCVAFFPGGRRLATGDSDGGVKFYHLDTGAEDGQVPVKVPAPLSFLTFSPSGKLLAGGGVDGSVAVWDLIAGKQLWQVKQHKFQVLALSFSPDEARLATCADGGQGDRTVYLYQATTGQRVLDLFVDDRPASGVTSVHFAPDGRVIVSVPNDNNPVVWDASSGALIKQVHSGEGARAFFRRSVLSPDNRLWAAADASGNAGIWELESGKRRKRLSLGEGGYAALAFSTDGSLMAFGAGRREEGSVHLCDTGTLRELCLLKGLSSGVTSVAFSPDDQVLATSTGDGNLWLWDVKKLRE